MVMATIRDVRHTTDDECIGRCPRPHHPPALPRGEVGAGLGDGSPVIDTAGSPRSTCGRRERGGEVVHDRARVVPTALSKRGR
jgi:hypothetical protein